jgi:hypothetical protein
MSVQDLPPDHAVKMSDHSREDDDLTTCRLTVTIIEEVESLASRNFLKLLCCLGGVDIPLSMLFRACDARKAWSIDGEIEEIFESDLLIGNLDRDTEMLKAIECLTSYELVKSNGESLSITPEMQLYSRELMSSWDVWRLQAVILVCHTFPRSRDLEES